MRLLVLALVPAVVCAFSGCASMEASEEDGPAVAPAPLLRRTPEQSYDAGMTALVRGDAAAAALEWDRCLAASAPDSPARLDCMVALEKLAVRSSSTP
jgi:hypothetical protein